VAIEVWWVEVVVDRVLAVLKNPELIVPRDVAVPLVVPDS
jgi:hypothetical protein